MPKGYSPAVFVSSTCYDLSQVRADLREFLEDQGLDPVLSEFNSFPVVPNHDTLQNSLNTVEEKADIFVLVIGGRYGHETDSGKSITNLEYLKAKAKGIPIYVFVHKAVLNILTVWSDNRKGDFSSVVESSKLLEFVQSIKQESKEWVFPFECAQDIVSILRVQLGYLFMETLDLYLGYRKSDWAELARQLGPSSLDIYYTKPRSWEFLLFAHVLKERITSLRKHRMDIEYNVAYGKGIVLSDLDDVANWLSARTGELQATVATMTRLINQGLQKAFREDGVEGDAQSIVFVATRIADGYKKLIDWALEFRNVQVDDRYKRLIDLTSTMVNNVIPEVEEFAENAFRKITETVANIDSIPKGTTIKVTCTLTVPDMSEFDAEIERLS